MILLWTEWEQTKSDYNHSKDIITNLFKPVNSENSLFWFWVQKVTRLQRSNLFFIRMHKNAMGSKRPVWSDVELKSSPIFPKRAQKVAMVIFTEQKYFKNC